MDKNQLILQQYQQWLANAQLQLATAAAENEELKQQLATAQEASRVGKPGPK